MFNDRLRDRLEKNEVACGVIIPWPDPHIVEIAGTFGFDYVLIDAEHGALDVRTCAELVRAADGVGMTPVVRVPYGDVRGAYTHLDAGALGIMFPHISSVGAAREAASTCLFGPAGTRAAIPSSRAARYGSVYGADEYYARANDAVWIMPLIEDVDAVHALEQILAVPGIRAFFIGPSDLALTASRESLSGLIDQAIATGLRLSKFVGIFAGTAADANAYVKKGVRLVLVGATGLFSAACKEYIADIRQVNLPRS